MRGRVLKIFMVLLVLLPVGLTGYLANSLYNRKGVPEALENLTKQLFRSKEEERKAETRAKALESKTEELQTAYDALVADLRGEVDSRDIRVRQFREKLEINFVDKVLFASGSAEVTPKGRDILSRVGAVLGKVKGKSIYVVGHTDNMPIHSALYLSNWELSSARASSVIRQLSEATGLSPERFTAMGRAFYQPVASNATPEGRQENRRVDIIVADVPLLAGETGSQSMRGTVPGHSDKPAEGEEGARGEPLRQTAPPAGSGLPGGPGAVALPPTGPVTTAPATSSPAVATPAGPAVAPVPTPTPETPPAAALPTSAAPDESGAAGAIAVPPAAAPVAPPTSAAPDAPGTAGAAATPPTSTPAAPAAPEPPAPQAKPAPVGVDQPGTALPEAVAGTPAGGASDAGQPGSPVLPPPLPEAAPTPGSRTGS